MNEPTIWYYISKVTLKEALREFKGLTTLAFGLVIFAGVFGVINYFLKDVFVATSFSQLNNFFKSIPWWIRAPFFYGIVLWFVRGQTFKMPMVDFKLCLVLTIVLSASLASLEYLPWWLSGPIFLLINLPLFYLDRLAEIGRAKIEEKGA